MFIYLWGGERGPTEHNNDKDDKLTRKHHGVHIHSTRANFRIINTTEKRHYRKTQPAREIQNRKLELLLHQLVQDQRGPAKFKCQDLGGVILFVQPSRLVDKINIHGGVQI